MALSFPSNEYKYGGLRYNLLAKLYIEGAREETETGLNTEKILKFEYVNRLNELCLTGTLEYVDDVGRVQNFMNFQYVILDVQHAVMEEEYDGPDIATCKTIPEASFRHEFVVDRFEITDRDENRVTYRLSLVSRNWFACAKTIDYSTYAGPKKPILEILRTCMADQGYAGLNVSQASFDEAQVPVEIDYVTNGNDNLFTVKDYLLKRTFYLGQRDSSVKFVWYNDLANLYGIFDLARPYALADGCGHILLSMGKSSFENVTAQDRN